MNERPPGPDRDRPPHLLLLFLATAALIFSAELGIMFIVLRVPGLTTLQEGMLDALLLAVAMFPSMYFVLVRPLRNHIAARRRVEAELRDSQSRFRNLVENTSDWVWEVDAQGRYTYSSPQLQALLGYAADEVLGKTPFELMPPEEAERVGKIFAGYAANRSPFARLDNVNLAKDGRRVVLETSGVPVFEGTEYRGYRGIDRDVTEARRLADAREELVTKLQAALEDVKRLGGLLPICAHCKSIRDDAGYWKKVEAYIAEHSEAEFTHSVCPACLVKYYGDDPGLA